MSKKNYQIFEVEEWRKKYSDSTDTHLKVWGYSPARDGISGEIVLTSKDDLTPESHQLFLVTIETLDRTTMPDDWEGRNKWMQARREKDEQENATVKTGRKFR